MQYLYLIQCQQFYKIGITNDVENRLAQLSTGNPFELKVLLMYGYDNAEIVERAIHQRFANSRKRGEWFELSLGDIGELAEICQLLGGKIDTLVVPTVNETEIEEAEVLAEPTDGAKWDYAAMFADGWRMEMANSKGWRWRNTKPQNGTPLNSSKIFIYGGLIKDLPQPIEEMNRIYRPKVLVSVGNE
jgi:hypothetical protein